MAKIKFAVGLLLLLSLLVSISPPTPVAADPDEVIWSRVNIPTEGKVGNWVLASGSDVAQLTIAIDDTLYAYVQGLSYTLYKSTDEGRSWSYSGEVTDAIVDIVCSSLDANIIYVTDGSHVYKSEDAGTSFSKVADTTLPTLDGNESITCLDVGYDASDDPYVFIATADTDGGDFGGVYYLPEADSEANWTDLQVGSYDVYSIAGSPEFKNDSQVIAIVTDETHTYTINNYGVVGDWTSGVELLEDDVTPFTITAASDIRFPSDFDEAYKLFIGVVGAGGDVYQVTSSIAYDLNIDTDIISLDLVGEAGSTQLLAGAAGSAQIYLSTDGGSSWVGSAKQPTGGSKTYVLMASNFTSSGKAYAATSGIESAFSYTTDDGITWNQLSLIDTEISNIVDLALSPNYSQDNTLFMLTSGSEHSLWRRLNSIPVWERVFTTTLANVDSINLVELSPQYGNTSQVVFLAGISSGNPAIWESTDNGQGFSPPRFTDDPTTSTPFFIDKWAAVDDNTLFVGSFDAINNQGLVYRTTDSGSTYSNPAVVGGHPLNSIGLSPNYEQDETILIGNTNGWVYWSNDSGISFEPLPPDAVSPPLSGNISVAFDFRFSSNSTVYAASDTAGSDIYRFIIGTSTSWESIDSTLPAGSILNQLMVSANGILYATNSQSVDTANKEGGMERCLNPSYSLGPTFETVTHGLDDGATLIGLWLSGNKLWSIDTTNIRLMTFTDSLVVPVILTSPPDQATSIDARNVNLDWRSASGATKYEWQLDYDTDFSSAPFEGDTKASSVRLPEQLKLATRYHWRVRVSEPLLSPWSATGSFTTSLGSNIIAPNLRSPGAGVKNVGLRPVFQWSAIAGADSYELLVSTNTFFTNPVITKIGTYALPTTAWQSDINLNYDTTYYWKVRASGSSSYSAWSAVSAFITESPPELTPPSSSSESSSPPLSSQATAPELYSPEASVSGVPLKPIFQWSVIAGADSYELLVSTDASFTNPIIIKIGTYALPSTAWQSDINLDYATTYYWKTRASGSSSYSAWSAVSAFTTESPPELTPLSSSSESSSQSTIPDWVQYLVSALLLTMLATLITVIILTVKVFRR